MVKYLKFNLHSLYIAIASILYVCKQINVIVNQLQHRLTAAAEVCYGCMRQRLSFAVEVTTGLQAPASLENQF